MRVKRNPEIDQERIFEALSEKYNIPIREVKKACKSQFKFLRDAMAAGYCDQVRIPFFGRFFVKPSKYKRYYENAKEAADKKFEKGVKSHLEYVHGEQNNGEET